MKLSSYYKSRACNIKLVRGQERNLDFDADFIEITSLFTYAWKPVHDAIEFYSSLIPDAKITVGGIYASIIPERIRSFFPQVNIQIGIHEGAEKYIPDYDILNDVEKWKGWNTSILFTSRGCIRKCPFCVVPKIEGEIKSTIEDIRHFIFPDHKKVIVWDNNFLASPNWKMMLNQFIELGLRVDFNQGLDARLIDEEKAALIADLKPENIRMAYDYPGERNAAHKAVELFEDQGIRRRRIFFYVLYNFYQSGYPYADTPEIFLDIIKDIAEMGSVSYPMRFEPLDSLSKGQFISPNWNTKRLGMIANARRVIGYGGAFPPYQGLINKFQNASSFDEAFELRPDSNRTQKLIIDGRGSVQRSASGSCIRAFGSPSRC
jgi:hypothetical protein